MGIYDPPAFVNDLIPKIKGAPQLLFYFFKNKIKEPDFATYIIWRISRGGGVKMGLSAIRRFLVIRKINITSLPIEDFPGSAGRMTGRNSTPLEMDMNIIICSSY